MKYALFSIILFALTSPSWQTDFGKAKQLAHDEKKMILLNFSGSDWCNRCIKMKEQVFSRETFTHFADENLVLLQADFPRTKKNRLDPELVKHNEQLAEKYNPAGKFPLTLLLDADGRIVKSWDGYKNATAEQFVNEVNLALH